MGCIGKKSIVVVPSLCVILQHWRNKEGKRGKDVMRGGDEKRGRGVMDQKAKEKMPGTLDKLGNTRMEYALGWKELGRP